VPASRAAFPLLSVWAIEEPTSKHRTIIVATVMQVSSLLTVFPFRRSGQGAWCKENLMVP
jgi:hypothetical protein